MSNITTPNYSPSACHMRQVSYINHRTYIATGVNLSLLGNSFSYTRYMFYRFNLIYCLVIFPFMDLMSKHMYVADWAIMAI